MKKIIISLFAITALFFTGCFIDSDTATVRINLGNIPIAKVEKKSFIDRFLLIFAKEAVAQGEPEILGIGEIKILVLNESEQLYIEKIIPISEYPVNNKVELTVPAGTNRTIRISAKDKVDPKVVYGAMIQTNLSPGETREIQVHMLGVPYSVNANTIPSLEISWHIDSAESLTYEFTVEWSETIDGEYMELVGEIPAIPVPGSYTWDITSGGPIESGYVRVRADSGTNMGIFCEPVSVTGT